MAVKKTVNIKHIATLSGHKSAVYALSEAIQPNCFYSSDGNGWLVHWDLNKGNDGVLIAGVPSNIFSILLLKKERLLAVGSMQGVLYFIDINNNEVLEPPIQLHETIFDLKAYQHYLLIAKAKGWLSFYDTKTKQLTKSLKIADKHLRKIVVDNTQNCAWLACSDGKIYQVCLLKQKLMQSFSYHSNSVFSLAMYNTTKHDNGKQQYLVSGSRDAHLGVWQIMPNNTIAVAHSIPAHMATVNDLAINTQQSLWASAGRDRSIKIWDTNNYQLLKVIEPLKPALPSHKHSVNCLYWQKNGYLISGSDDKKIMVWQVEA